MVEYTKFKVTRAYAGSSKEERERESRMPSAHTRAY